MEFEIPLHDVTFPPLSHHELVLQFSAVLTDTHYRLLQQKPRSAGLNAA
jgi:hypothetical protein